MANVTLVRAIQGSDPQNMMEYITRQKIYDSRYWKEDCFGLAAVDVLEKAATLKTIGGLPSKFLSLTLKLLQLNPEPEDIIETFVLQDEFKYVRALGALYVRLVGRPPDIYETLEPLYRDYRKLRCRMHHNDWSMVHMDEFIHELLTGTTCVGITLPRLPARSTLQEAGYLEEGPRPTALKDVLEEAGGPLAFLKLKVEQGSTSATALWEKRNPRKKDAKQSAAPEEDKEDGEAEQEKRHRHHHRRHDSEDRERKKQKEDKDKHHKKRHREKEEAEEGEISADHHDEDDGSKTKKKRNYAGLFKTDSKKKKSRRDKKENGEEPSKQQSSAPDEHSEEYWNEQRAKLGLSKLR